jgi:RNA polymerase sigma-70 factor (sigma-E family)
MVGTGGSGVSFEAFVRNRSTHLLRVALLLCGDRGHAEDLLQSALARTARHWDGIDSPEAYVRAALINGAKNRWRGRRVLEVQLGEADDVAAPGGDQERVTLRQALLTELSRLSHGQRAVLVLRYFEDLSEAETAQALGCSTGTVKSQTARALARLRTTTLHESSAIHDGDRTLK